MFNWIKNKIKMDIEVKRLKFERERDEEFHKKYGEYPRAYYNRVFFEARIKAIKAIKV